MDLKLKGKRTRVTGFTAGIGWAIAHELAAEGVAVVINGRDATRLAQAVERLSAEVRSAELIAVQTDVGTADGCEHLAEAACDVDILVNNCGIYELIAEGSAGMDVSVNAVLPSPTRTAAAIAFIEHLTRETGCADSDGEQAFSSEQRPTSLQHRFVEPTEIAATAAFMRSPLAAAMNGTALRVEGARFVL